MDLLKAVLAALLLAAAIVGGGCAAYRALNRGQTATGLEGVQ